MKLTPAELSRLAYEAVISGSPNARELTDSAVAAYAESQTRELVSA